ncbi:phosphoenolpyruvate--protein phosphotransferase [uncultured Merdimmobilis sp.]|uniref:phosphoenolpyruvate--protein phosphotransferase n=1 Tax=uncultured Merdimmobilis sp. TaxID=3028859 RepID=UPI002804F652|nr:phosphoenolpyruvate--protein phosphotransferase [uncultured Merdimmobilis sp.]
MVFTGIGASSGLALAPAFCLTPKQGPVGRASSRSFEEAREQLKRQYDQSIAALTGAGRRAEAEVLLCHREMVSDVLLEERVNQGLIQGLDPAAVEKACHILCQMLAQVNSDYIRQRAEDLKDVCSRLISLLCQEELPSLAGLEREVVLVAHQLSPADLATADLACIKGIVLAGGTLTSHIAILACSLGIPAVVGCPHAVEAAKSGEPLFLDGASGKVECGLTHRRKTELARLVKEEGERVCQLAQQALLPSVTADGLPIRVESSISDSRTAQKSVEYAADAVGLLRTEFLFHNRESLPGEEEQLQYYLEIARQLGGQRFTIRTLDIGGDKPSPCIPIPKEENPFLGTRGIRLTLRQPEILLCQLRAILRASAQADIQVMYPMITSLEELQAAKQWMDTAKKQLAQEGLPFDPAIREGIMVEVPSAALLCDLLAPHCDFFSIGSNDLAQYLLAADRNGECLPQLGSYLHPAVLRVIQMVLDRAAEEGIPCSLCGEMAKDPLATPLLLGMGLTNFVVTPAAIPALKEGISRLDTGACRRIARQALSCSTAGEVVRLLQMEREQTVPAR